MQNSELSVSQAEINEAVNNVVSAERKRSADIAAACAFAGVDATPLINNGATVEQVYAMLKMTGPPAPHVSPAKAGAFGIGSNKAISGD